MVFSGATDSSSFGSCSPSMAYDVDEAMSTSSWKSPSMERERDWWSVDFEGEMEKLEVGGGFSGAEGGSMDPERKTDHWPARTVLTEESEEVKGAENEKQGVEVDEVVPGMQTSSNETYGGTMLCEVEEQEEARVEVQGPKRRVIRVESEETQDYVRETLAIIQEEADEIGSVPSVFSEPRQAHYWCENRCIDKALSYMQIASMVIEEGGEARTINFCKLCHNAKLVQQGNQPQKSKEWKEVLEKKAHRGRLWKIFRNRTLSGRNVGVCRSQKDLGKEHSSGRRSRKTRRKARSVAKWVSLQSSSGAGQKMCGYRLRSPDNASCPQRTS